MIHAILKKQLSKHKKEEQLYWYGTPMYRIIDKDGVSNIDYLKAAIKNLQTDDD